MKFVKQTGSVEQTFYQGLSSFLNLYATALASSLGREVWEPFALLSVTGTHPNIRFPPPEVPGTTVDDYRGLWYHFWV